MNYYSHHIGDYLTDTAHLSILEDGAYRRLMDRYYTSEEPLTADENALFRFLRARTDDEKEAIRIVLAEFFTLTDGGWTHKRCDAEIAAYKEKSIKAADAANKRWNKPSNADAMPTHSERITDAMPTNNQEPITNNQDKEKTKPKSQAAARPASLSVSDLIAEGVDEQVATDFLTVRRRKRAPLTELAMKGIRREADKAGWTVDAALKKCVERGWTAFEAGWVAGNQRSGVVPINKQEALEARNRQVGEAWAARMQGGSL